MNYINFKTKFGELVIKLNESNNSCEVFNECSKRPIDKIKDNQTEARREIYESIFIISPSKRIEIDGIFEVKNFHLPNFNDYEASFLYKNFKENDIPDFFYVITEIKLSSKRLSDLIILIVFDVLIFRF